MVDLCGKYNRITLIEKTNERSKSGKTIYKGICDCGEVRYLVGSSVKSGHIKSCGCLKREMVCKKNKDNAYDLSGTTVGMLTVIRKTGRIKQTQHEYECLCKCGRTTYAYTSQLVKGNKKERKSCGCIQGQNFYDDLTGKKFNNVLVIGDDGTRTKNFQVLWLCQCQECGKEWHVRGSDLKNNKVMSCGCCKHITQNILGDYVESIFSEPVMRNEWNDHGLRFPDSKYRMQIDIWIPKRKLALEYQGEFHYKRVFEGFDRAVQRDEMKRTACKESGITLIEIDYRWDKSIDALKNTLKDHGILI